MTSQSDQMMHAPHDAARTHAAIHPNWRAYAVIAVAVQIGVLGMMFSQSGAKVTGLHGVIAVGTLGLLLIAINQPIGRSIFIPAAIVQIFLLGFGSILGFLGLLAAWFQQSKPAAVQAAILTLVCAFDTVILLFGLRMVFGEFKRVSPMIE